MTPRKLFGVVAGMAGICLIVGVEALAGLGEQLVAQIVIVLAAICYAGAAIFGRGFKDLDPMAPAAGSLLCGAAILIPVSLVVDRPWTLAPSMSSVLALLGLAVFSTAVAFVIYFRLIQTLGSVGTTAQAYCACRSASRLGVLFLGERPVADGVDRACLRRGRRRRDDDPGATDGEADQASSPERAAHASAAVAANLALAQCRPVRSESPARSATSIRNISLRCPISPVGAKVVREAGITAD